MKNVIKVILLCIIIFLIQPSITSFANSFMVTPGVEYKKGVNKWGDKAQSIHTVEIDVSRPEITVDALIPNPLNSRQRLTNILKENSSNGEHVVAGINASFFHTNSGAPAYLLSADGLVNTYGVISSGNDEYMSVPTAFAIDENGKGQVGQFDYEATVETGNVIKDISSVNKGRTAGEIILYTPSYSYSSTRSNEYGMELVLTNFSGSIEEGYELGEKVTAKVSAITKYGDRDSPIPKNGAVISIQGGEQAAEFKDVKVGDEVSLTIDLKKPWKNADFVLASGPLLVQNGKVDMTINPNSSRAKSIHPRTAVAINRDGSKVFFVTVDGRKAGSTGMNLTEFSQYLVSIGAYAALNLDGGGSTTMAVRKPGDLYPSLFNNPSDNYERAISAALGAVSLTILNDGTLIQSFENSIEWVPDSARAKTSLSFEGAKAPVKDGNTALKLSYDFTAYKDGTSASYVVAKKPIEILGKPVNLGLWVYGDGASHWLRGQITDGKGTMHTIDFTENNGLDWKGWKYVKASIPASIQGPIALNRIYIAETSSEKKNSGSIYVDRLIAEYSNTYEEPLFNDVSLDHRAAKEIDYAVGKGWIQGDIDGKFNPDGNTSRAHAAVLISRVLNITSNNQTGFNDVSAAHRYSKEIAAVVEAGIMSGKNPTTFDPDGFLTRAQMAKILVNAYGLKANPAEYDVLKDVPKSFWAFDDIHVLRANGITVVEDGFYRPFERVQRYQIAVFLTRLDQK